MVEVIGNPISLKALYIVNPKEIPKLDFQFYNLDFGYNDNRLILYIITELLITMEPIHLKMSTRLFNKIFCSRIIHPTFY
jgi:hypothetical protein